MNESFNRKYIVVLSAVSVVVLAGGAMLRPKKRAPEQPSPSEMASLQARVRRESLSEAAGYFADRAQAVSAFVQYQPAYAATAVLWRRDGQLLTSHGLETSERDPIAALPGKTAQSAPRAGQPIAGQWVLIVAREPEGQLIWTPAVFGGSRQSTCAGAPYRQLIVNARPGVAMVGGGVFDLDGSLLGVAVNCSDGGMRLVALESVPAMLETFARTSHQLETNYGIRVSAVNAEFQSIFGVETGLVITEVVKGSVAEEVGLQPGDVIVRAGGELLNEESQLATSLAATEVELQIMRQRRVAKVRMSQQADHPAGLHIVPSPARGAEVTVAADSVAYRAGLRSGDQLIQIGGKPIVTTAELSRALAAAKGPVAVVYQRDKTRRLALIQP